MKGKKVKRLLDEVRARTNRDNYVDNLRDGRKQRAVTFKPGKGKGSYKRKTKHKEW